MALNTGNKEVVNRTVALLYEEEGELAKFKERLSSTTITSLTTNRTSLVTEEVYFPGDSILITQYLPLKNSPQVEHKLGGLVIQGIHILDGTWSNEQLNYIFTRIRSI